MQQSFVIKLRGLPWSVTETDILKFLKGIDVQNGLYGIHLLKNIRGRLSGEAFAELKDENHLEIALKRNNGLMGHRYIEVFRSNKEQMNAYLEESKFFSNNWQEPVVRLRGLPFGCVKNEILNFFQGLNLKPENILMVIDFTGRFNGEAFVKFNKMDDAYEALNRHKRMIAHRYIEVFQSCTQEMKHYETNSKLSIKYNESLRTQNYLTNKNRLNINRNSKSQYDSYIDEYRLKISEPKPFRRTTHRIKMRGLPFNICKEDILKFFEPLMPCNIILFYDNMGRLNGEAEVDFNTHLDACEAMKYDNKFIGNRYIELFLLSGSNLRLLSSTKANQHKHRNKKFDQYILRPQKDRM